VASFVPFWSLETAGFGDPEKRLTGVVFLGLSPTAMPNSSDSSVVADATFLPQTLVVPPSGGKTLSAYGDTTQVKLSGEQTNGSMVVITNSTPPQSGPPPHRHRNEDEMFLVLEGKVRFLANGQWTEPLEPGTVVYTPRGVVHTFQNVGETSSRQLVIGTPSGFELFFSKSAEIFAAAVYGADPGDQRRTWNRIRSSAGHWLTLIASIVLDFCLGWPCILRQPLAQKPRTTTTTIRDRGSWRTAYHGSIRRLGCGT
jgi:quercetin dioxygenase-like cupin family protein